ncbi:protein kinase [Lujinxingia vulgaris]|uniref:Protein kinase n=1 Tax=Lujinxingia vulgaris TaxID=2600176 RepID=A0A5C6XFE0_9DELT|nr:protein kinase [Lujinxingia vulgaris]TXD36139.1 protein kinase [Lujinxingia vulgaris]
MSRRSFFEQFELIDPIGRGAMGAIWRARHRGEGEEVAVKVLGSSYSARDTIQAAFGDEVRAVASLRHPGIIDVYDYGELLADDPLPNHPDLRVGSPYLVMELADGGSLEERAEAMSWSQIRALLLGLLDALAHAHARDLVHRDIKPANILRFGRGEHTRFKLADFGIAHAIASPAESSGEHNASGTPLYMAPEQFTDQRREFGPWTDLYALGCVAFELLSGRPPYDARSFVGLYDQHSNAPIPHPDVPEGAVPEGLQGWLMRLLAKDPRARFACAADAAWALLTLPAARFPDRVLWDSPTSPTLPGRLPTTPLTLATLSEVAAATRAPQSPSLLPPSQRPGVEDQPHSTRPSGGNPTAAYPAASDAPPLPATWRAAHTPAAKPRWLGGVGVGLFGLRPTPMVGRKAERDQLWEALRSAAAHKRCGLVIVRGAAGTGTSRLASWLATRARELGVATAMQATLKADATATSALVEMVRHHLRVVGLSGEELIERLGRALPPQLDSPTLTRLAELLEDRSALPLDAQLSTIARVIRARATTRPLVLVLDDVQWGAGALRLCAQLLRSEDQFPILIVATLGDEALAERDEEQALIADLLTTSDDARVSDIHLRALPPEDHHQLVANLLGLHHDLGRRIAERSNGNPLFAIELVGDWIQRGILQPGPRGFEIPDLALAEESLPDDLLSMGSERLRTLMQTSTLGPYRQAVEVAATLGQLVSVPLWRQVCARAGVEAPPWLMAELMRLRLVEGTRESVAFVQGMVREALLEDARKSGRLADFHRAAAEELMREGMPAALASREQLARHLAGAGAHRDALPHLLELGDRYLVQGDTSAARRLSAHALASLHHAALPRQSASGVHLDLLEARIHIERLESVRAAEQAARALENATALNLPAACARANELLARCNRSFNIYDRAVHFFDQALALYLQVGDATSRASAQEGKAWTLVLLGQIPAAEATYLDAIATLEETFPVPVRALADAYNGLAEIRRRQRRFDDADLLLAQQEDLARRFGHASALCDAFNTRAEIAREQGDYARARELYETAFRYLAETGARIGDIAHLNLALVDLFGGELEGALAAFEALVARMPEDHSFAYRAYIYAALTAAYAELQRWEDARTQLHNFIRDQNATKIFDLDIAMCLSRGADHALRHGQSALAEPLLRQAIHQWERIDRGARAAEERARLSALTL